MATCTQPFSSIREQMEAREASMLHPAACLSATSAGRLRTETPCTLRTAFQRDRDRILHSKAFRRLKHKTQVFIRPEGDHYRTRLTHSLEVAQVSRTIARALRLNEDLTESIALGHDLGHPPFGHGGEKILNELYAHGFHHQAQSVRIVTRLEDLNLSAEVVAGIAGVVPGQETESTLEAQIVNLADRMAYLHHDVEDALRAGMMQEKDLPVDILADLGDNRQDRLARMVIDLVETSLATFDTDTPRIALSPGVHTSVMALRGWMFRHVYLTENRRAQQDSVRRVITGLYGHCLAHPEVISDNIPADSPPERRAVDYLAGMTDRFAIDLYKKWLLPNPHMAVTNRLFELPESQEEWL